MQKNHPFSEDFHFRIMLHLLVLHAGIGLILLWAGKRDANIRCN